MLIRWIIKLCSIVGAWICPLSRLYRASETNSVNRIFDKYLIFVSLYFPKNLLISLQSLFLCVFSCHAVTVWKSFVATSLSNCFCYLKIACALSCLTHSIGTGGKIFHRYQLCNALVSQSND